jgi:hypothetical protein
MAAGRQGELFAAGAESGSSPGAGSLPLSQHQVLAWQIRLAAVQQPIFEAAGSASLQGPSPGLEQGNLFTPHPTSQPADPAALAARLNPLAFAPQSLQFWRWPEPPQAGAALYLVIDQPPHLDSPLLLYVGETGRADQRWKGEHDCKAYLAAYAEAVLKAGFTTRLSIRFCCDVPAAARPRRALEQALIRRWLPPFNKETRRRWATPFTADPA